MTEPSFLIAFGIGILSFLAPCTLPVLPGYFSYLAGVNQEKNERKKRVKIFFASLSFAFGFLLVLVVLGATASAAGQFLLKNRNFWQKIGGLFIVIFGLQTMGVIQGLRLTIPDRRYNPDRGSGRKREAFLTGASFGIGWTPCIGPILGSILILAAQTQTLSRGVGLLTSYALGLSIPLLLSGFFLGQLKFLRRPYVPLISGGILIILGVMLFLDQYSKLTIWTERVYRFLKIPIF